MVPLLIGMKMVIAKSFARIFRQNLINFGAIPLVFTDPGDYDKIDSDDVLVIEDAIGQLKGGAVRITNQTKNVTFETAGDFTDREKELILQGGLLNYLRLKNI